MKQLAVAKEEIQEQRSQYESLTVVIKSLQESLDLQNKGIKKENGNCLRIGSLQVSNTDESNSSSEEEMSTDNSDNDTEVEEDLDFSPLLLPKTAPALSPLIKKIEKPKSPSKPSTTTDQQEIPKTMEKGSVSVILRQPGKCPRSKKKFRRERVEKRLI